MNTYIFPLSAEDCVDTDDLDVDVLDLLKKRGRIFSCTPLQNISFRRSDLRKFNDLLANDILKHESNQSIKYNATFNRVDTNSTQSFLKISVEKCQNNRALGVVYEGLFFTWKLNDSGDQNDVNLPLLYCIGNQRIVNLINSVIERQFSCTISATIFSQSEFKWLVVLALQHITHTPKDIQLVYEIPRIESKFSFFVSFETLKDIWKRIRTETEEESNNIEYGEVASLHAAFEEHVINTYGVDLTHFHLKMVSIPGYLTLDVSGKVQISKNELFDFFYRLMNDAMLLR
ncbi:uncharacterized protein LOC135834764 [Planococcus citri]|uniref:uncharacterized protein LOC135834764 n=1 Tax=Planococcus citri TaxID=170843 RepID=UPI0031F9D32E